MSLIQEREIIGLLISLATATDTRKKLGNPPPYSDYHTTGPIHYANQALEYKRRTETFNAADRDVAGAIKNLEAWLPEPTLKALDAGEAFISQAPSTSGAPNAVEFLLLDKKAGKYRVIRKASEEEAVKAHKSAAA